MLIPVAHKINFSRNITFITFFILTHHPDLAEMGRTKLRNGERLSARRSTEPEMSLTPSPSLTKNAIRTLTQSKDSRFMPAFKPIIQLINVKNLKKESDGSDRYRLILSDGQCFVQGMVATQLNKLIANGIRENNIIRVNEYMVNYIKGKSICVVLCMDIVDANITETIGSPVDVDKADDATNMAPSNVNDAYNHDKMEQVSNTSTEICRLKQSPIPVHVPKFTGRFVPPDMTRGSEYPPNTHVPKFTWNPATQKHMQLRTEVRNDRSGTAKNSNNDSFNIVSNGCDTFCFPPGSCLAPDYVGNEGLDVFHFHYELRPDYLSEINSSDDCSPREYSLLSKIITPQHTLRNGVEKHTRAVINSLLRDTKPVHYECKNDFVTERFLMFGKVCIHRQFLWNVNHPESLIRIQDDEADSYGCLSLEEELIYSLYSKKSDSKTIPTKEQRPSAGISTYDPASDKHTAFFHPTYKELILKALWGCGHFFFFPMHHFPQKYFVTHNNCNDHGSQMRRKIKVCKEHDPNATKWSYSYKCGVHDCVHCHQDTCVWKLNSTIILEEIQFLCAGPFSCFRTQRDRALLAQKLAMFLLRPGFGRFYEGKSVPKCIIEGCNNLWPKTDLDTDFTSPIHIHKCNIRSAMFKNLFISNMNRGSTLSKMHHSSDPRDLRYPGVQKDVTLQVIHHSIPFPTVFPRVQELVLSDGHRKITAFVGEVEEKDYHLLPDNHPLQFTLENMCYVDHYNYNAPKRLVQDDYIFITIQSYVCVKSKFAHPGFSPPYSSNYLRIAKFSMDSQLQFDEEINYSLPQNRHHLDYSRLINKNEDP